MEAAYETVLLSTSRLHDLFIRIEGMTPAEYKHGGKNLTINYSFAESPFGNLLVASTTNGICYVASSEDENRALEILKYKFPSASFSRKPDLTQKNVSLIFQHDWSKLPQIKLPLKGTDFQLCLERR